MHAPMFCRFLVIAAFLVVSPRAATAEDKPTFQAGFAERDITPEIGMEQPGGYGKSYHKSFHDACKVRACVLTDGHERVALVGLDALAIRRPTVLNARRMIHERTGIAPESILISASHSHSSGPTAMILPDEFDGAPAEVRELAYKQSSCADAKYLAKVEQAIADAVVEAHERSKPAVAGVGYGVEDQVAFNRRFRMSNGLTMTHPRQGNPEIIEVAGPTDPQVGVLGVWDDKHKLLGCIVNFACHATTSPGGISANYIHYLEQVIRGALGPDAVVIYLPGCSGDVTQVDNLSPHVGRGAEDWARFVGGRVGAEAVKVLLTVESAALTPIHARTTTIPLKRRMPRSERIEHARQIVKRDPKKTDATELTFAKEIVLLDWLGQQEPVRQVELQAVQVGPAVFLTNPAEFFCEFGLELKKESGFPFTFPVELANDCIGYVPTVEALGPHGGGYETRLTSYSNLEKTAGPQIVAADLKLAHELKPGVVPERAKAPPFEGGAWTYGALPPELD